MDMRRSVYEINNELIPK